MGVQVSREFASSLIIACQNEASPNLGEHVLSQPEFLQAALAFAKAVRDFPGLPHEVRLAIEGRQRKQRGDRLRTPRRIVSSRSSLEKASPPTPNDVSMWMNELHSTSNGDLAAQLYEDLSKLPSTGSLKELAFRRIRLVEFYHLQVDFSANFVPCNSGPLSIFLSRRLGLNIKQVKKTCQGWSSAGQRLHDISQRLDGYGALLLPHNVARTTLESHVANDEHLDTAVKSLRGYGVFKSEATKHCFDEASTLFTAQKSRRKDLIMALRHNVPLTPTTGQISIDQVDIGITRSAQGPDSIALSGWYEDMNSWCGMENFATDTHIESGLSGMSNLDDIMALAGRLDS